jgi:hypothetical protein
MRSLIIFLCVAQVIAGVIMFFLASYDRHMPYIEQLDMSIGAVLLLAALAASIVALALARFSWTRWLGLVVALILPALFAAYELGLPVPQSFSFNPDTSFIDREASDSI